MDPPTVHSRPARSLWQLAARQHGLVTRTQLLEAGHKPDAIKHRIATGRLHPVRRGVYALGRPELNQHGRWLAAVLACGREAVLSHASAGALWGLHRAVPGPIDVSVPKRLRRRQRGITLHRRGLLGRNDVTRQHGVPVTTPACTLIDLATLLGGGDLEAAVNEADKRDLVDPERLRALLDETAGRPGTKALRETLDRRTFRLTDSELERRFLRLVWKAELPTPETGCRVNGFKVDFYWPGLGLVVETDGLRYHRTPAQQARDRVRDQAHSASGLTPLRFTAAQVRFEPNRVEETLIAVARRLEARAPVRSPADASTSPP